MVPAPRRVDDGPRARAPRGPRRERGLRRALGAGAALLLLGTVAVAAPPLVRLFEGGARPLEVGPVPDGLTGTDAASCEPCHTEIAAEWRESLHAAAWTDPVFQAAYAVEPFAFCRNCHAPLHRGDTPTGVAASEGVSCAVCHVRQGGILGAGRAGSGDAAPHPVFVTTRLGDSAYCAPCHEFGFLARTAPGHPHQETEERQQSTFSEWLARRKAGETRSSCQGCHMPERGEGPARHRDHRFRVQADPELIAGAVAVELAAARAGADVVVSARLVPRAVGHAVPTGDLFRRLVLSVWPEGGEGATVSLEYARRFADRRSPGSSGSGQHQVADERVGQDGGRPRELILRGAGPGIPLRWRLDYLLMPVELARRHGIAPATNVTTVSAGLIPAP